MIRNERAQQDALLAGLGRLTTAPRPARRPHRTEPFKPVSRLDTLEIVERATGLGRSEADHAAVEKLLHMIRSASLDAVDVLRAIVAGSQPSDAPLNARVLSVLHWLCLAGGPVVLPSAAWSGSTRKPGPGLRICLDVLRSFGHEDDDAGDVLYDDNRVRSMQLGAHGMPRDALNRCRVSSASVFAAAVETYAIALGRKLVFHSRYADVEANYSLDRFFRGLHVENDADPSRREANDERYAVIVSHVSIAEMALLTRAMVAAVQRLLDANAPGDVVAVVLGEAANAYAFASYLRRKVRVDEEIDLKEEHAWLAHRLRLVVDRGGPEAKVLKRIVDGGVFRAITEGERVVRPESRHRREIVCRFTSFQGLHRAMRPPMHVRR